MESNASVARRRLLLARHGEVSYFDRDGRPFRPDTVPLNDEGRSQAESTRDAIVSVPIDRVITSGLPRTDETATILLGSRGIAIERREALREIQTGRLRDIPLESLEHSFVGAFTDGIHRDTRFLGGETFGSLVDRVLACFQELIADPTWRQLLIVAHGGVNRAILCHALGSGLTGFAAIEQDACCLNIIDFDSSGRFIVRLLNMTAYNLTKGGLERTTMERLFLEYCERTGRPRTGRELP
jgi:broad specificity phosphatase PhoE